MNSFVRSIRLFFVSLQKIQRKKTIKIAGLTSYTALFKVKGRFAVEFPRGNSFAHSPLMRISGIEPEPLAWKAKIIPLDHIRNLIYFRFFETILCLVCQLYFLNLAVSPNPHEAHIFLVLCIATLPHLLQMMCVLLFFLPNDAFPSVAIEITYCYFYKYLLTVYMYEKRIGNIPHSLR